MLSQLIQRQISIGSAVIFTLKDGREVSGVLIEIGRDHVTIDSAGESITILTEMIGTWRIPKGGESLHQESPMPKPMPAHVSPPEPSDQETIKKLLEIEAHFQAQQQVSSLQVKVPDFMLPATEISGKSSANALTVWNRIKDKYQYAEKINELSAKFGRIQPLAQELAYLAEHFPHSASIKRHVAYFYHLLGNHQESLNLYQAAAISSDNAWDWYNLATKALTSEQDALAYYALGRFFQIVPNTESLSAWYVYIGLVSQFSDYRTIKDIVQKRAASASEKESQLLLETGIYLLLTTEDKAFAADMVQRWIKGDVLKALVLDAFARLQGLPNETYQRLISELVEEEITQPAKVIPDNPQGFVYSYKSDRSFGFLKDNDGETYFFHITAVSDDDLLEQLRDFSPGKRIPVTFEPSQGPKGPIAIRVTLHRTLDQMFARATQYANDGDYSKAIALVKKVLDANPNYPSAQEAYDKWREYARVSGVPRGANAYARAKRLQLIEKDLERAAQLLRDAIKKGDNAESAVKDLAMLLVQLGRSEEAIQVLEGSRSRISSQQSVDNMLIGFYQNAGQHDKAISLLEKKLKQATTESKKAQILWQIAIGYLRKEDYALAEQTFRKVLQAQPDNRTAQRNIALCLFKQGHYEEAQKILNHILITTPDAQAAELLEAIKQAQSGQMLPINELIVETALSDISREISGFAKFFLERCDYQGVPPDHIQSQNFDRNDILTLEQLATRSRTIRPRERAGYYLSAAKITSFLEDEDPNQFYKYLCRSFASSGDAIVVENRPLDAAREFYCESLSAYDGDRSRSRDEQDAVNALVRFLFSTMGQAQIPMKPSIPSIDESLENVLTHHPDGNKVFDAIAYLVFRSRYAANRFLNRLYEKSSWQAMALGYLRSAGIGVGVVKRLDDFVRLWNELVRKKLDEHRSLRNEFRTLAQIEPTTASLGHAIERVKTIAGNLFFDLDQQRAIQIQRILETALELCSQTAFEEKERLCIQIGNRCQDLLREIEASPTKISVEEMYTLIKGIQAKIKAHLEQLYETSIPQLTLRLPVETYTPDNSRSLEVQVVVSNRAGCSPAEAVELVVQAYEETFSVKLDGSLRGGEQLILRVPIQPSEEALSAQAFSLPIYAHYRTRSGEIQQTPVANFSIRFSSEQEFEEIENPYTPYAEGGIVGEPTMFYGRDDLIANIARVIETSQAQSKCVVIYGQKRSGKSSILHHLASRLSRNDNLLIIDIDIGSIIDKQSSIPFLYQILWRMLSRFRDKVEDRVEQGKTLPQISFPGDIQFYNHPSPLMFFVEIFEQFLRSGTKLQDWKECRIVMLIDEFTYIYDFIVNGTIPDTFMKNWKSLLQANLFNAVLVGQDYMRKFKQRFPNEFGTTQDERVTYLRGEDATRLIDEPIWIGGRQGESRYRERAIERILELTAGNPFYIQILCNRLVEYMNRKKASLVTEADVEQVKDELIRGVNALGKDKFDNLINSGDKSPDAISDEDVLKVLISIAENSRTGPCSRSNIAYETHTPVDEILEDLVRRDVVERERGQYYSIRVGLFREWLFAHR